MVKMFTFGIKIKMDMIVHSTSVVSMIKRV